MVIARAWAAFTVQGMKPCTWESGCKGKDMARDEQCTIPVKQAITMDSGWGI